MTQAQEITPKKRVRSKFVTIAMWLVVALLIPTCGAWVIGRWVYWFDIMASGQMLISWIALCLGVLVLVTRRWAAGVVCIALVGVSFYPTVVGRVLVLPTVDFEHKPIGALRVVSSNINPKNESWKEDIAFLSDLDADVIVLLEASPTMSRAIIKYGILDGTRYRHWARRSWVQYETSPSYILSRWPIEEIHPAADRKVLQDQLYVKVFLEHREVLVGLAHPLSPRTKIRWESGNRVIQNQIDSIAQITSDTGLPLVFGTDLNAGPAQLRGATLAQAGLTMSKPVARIGGSFPVKVGIPEALRIQLDDVWSMGDITPIAWSMIEISGSDHMTVVVDFEFATKY